MFVVTSDNHGLQYNPPECGLFLKRVFPGTIPEFALQVEEKLMNLYFNFSLDDRSNQISEATLRLHAIIQKNSTNSGSINCTQKIGEEDKMLRVSAYYYVKNQKNKRRGKRFCFISFVSHLPEYQKNDNRKSKNKNDSNIYK